MERFEHLNMTYERRKDAIATIYSRINRGESPNNEMTGLIGANLLYAIKSFYIDIDVQSTKLHFYRSAKAAEYAILHFNPRMIESGLNYISTAFLSDNPYLIESYSEMSTEHEFFIGFQVINAMQNILNGKLDNLPENIKQITRFCSTKTFKNFAPMIPVFDAFLNKDKTALEQALLELLATHKKRNTDPLISRFMSLDTAGLCKLAWIKGYEIDLKSDLVPLELMPIKPLERYEDDEVLKMLLNVN